ncbi:hypothetical protein BV25DRAFT_1898676 [Artomyces pyxidatus]|uniref:Uncharacterized protein n=1 Tax=Artomyces pyxidatus TaxID=48021 RepID=A0ACB8T8B1_9AGAM|nr:hypothetical protein BV25DRAFT_1898676 [Artomyces pyxidatus]
MTPYRPGQIFACQESVHTPARRALELPDVGSRTTCSNVSQWTAPTMINSDRSTRKTRPCLIMPNWGADSTDDLQICVMGTFKKARRSELAAVHRYFNVPIFPHTEYRIDDIYVKANVQWEKNAWLVAYPFVPVHPLLKPWRVRGVNAEVKEVVWLKRHSKDLVDKWKQQTKDTVILQRLQQNYRFIRGKVAHQERMDHIAAHSMPVIHEVLEKPFQGARAKPSGDYGPCISPPRSPTRTRQLTRRLSAQWITVKPKSRRANSSRTSVAFSTSPVDGM